MVEGEQHPVGDEIDPSKDAPHARQEKPRNSSSSPRKELKIWSTTTTANQPHAPRKNSWPRSEGRNTVKSLLEGPVMLMPKASQSANRRKKGVTHNQILPPTRPLLGSWGGSSQRASRTRDQRS